MSLGDIFTDPRAYADPDAWHATAKQIRDTESILRVDNPKYPIFHAITKHADVRAVSTQPGLFSSAQGIRPDSPPVAMMIDMDDPQHLLDVLKARAEGRPVAQRRWRCAVGRLGPGSV